MQLFHTVSVLFNFIKVYLSSEKRDSSVGIALCYGLDDRCSRLRFPTGAGNFSLRRRVRGVSGARPASYLMGVKRPGREADHSPPSIPDVKNA
jgi:hypothetical protein